jgi:hypothetical protein
MQQTANKVKSCAKSTHKLFVSPSMKIQKNEAKKSRFQRLFERFYRSNQRSLPDLLSGRNTFVGHTQQHLYFFRYLLATRKMKGAETPMREIRLRLFACAVVCLLSFDAINPVKIFSEVLEIHTGWFFLLSLLFSASIVWGNVNDLIYFSTKIFFKSILSIFFSSIEVITNSIGLMCEHEYISRHASSVSVLHS